MDMWSSHKMGVRVILLFKCTYILVITQFGQSGWLTIRSIPAQNTIIMLADASTFSKSVLLKSLLNDFM